MGRHKALGSRHGKAGQRDWCLTFTGSWSCSGKLPLNFSIFPDMVRACLPYCSEVRTGETMGASGSSHGEKLRDAEHVFVAQVLHEVLFPCL